MSSLIADSLHPGSVWLGRTAVDVLGYDAPMLADPHHSFDNWRYGYGDDALLSERAAAVAVITNGFGFDDGLIGVALGCS